MKPVATKAAGQEWAVKARAEGFDIIVSGGGSILGLRKHFAPGDNLAYVDAENEALYLLAEVPVTGPGSIWGNTSDGVGGIVAINSGSFTLKQSGVSKRFVSGVLVP